MAELHYEEPIIVNEQPEIKIEGHTIDAIIPLSGRKYVVLLECTGRPNREDINRLKCSPKLLKKLHLDHNVHLIPVIHAEGRVHEMFRKWVWSERVKGYSIVLMRCTERLKSKLPL